uniref:hypothetical protein n=1 Tax=Agathobacter sp. TaxID=2021311 RepID=UPI0040561653
MGKNFDEIKKNFTNGFVWDRMISVKNIWKMAKASNNLMGLGVFGVFFYLFTIFYCKMKIKD